MQFNIISPKQQVIFILYSGCSQTDFSKIKFENRNLILICTNNNLRKLPLSQSQSFSLIKTVEELNLEVLTRIYQQIKSDYRISDNRCQAITNEPDLAFLTAQFDEYLMILGEGLRQDKNHIAQNSITIHQFSSKKNLKHSLRFSFVKLSNFLPFEGHKYCCEPISYLNFIEENIGHNILVKSINTDIIQKQIIKDNIEFKYWCEANIYSEIEYEFSELLNTEKYGISIAIKSDEAHLFAIYKYLDNLSVLSNGNILERENPIYQNIIEYSVEILQMLRHGYPSNGIINFIFYLSKEDKLILEEITVGSPDNYVSKIIEDSQGVNFNDLHLQLQIGDPVNIKTKNTHKNCGKAA